MSSLHTISTSKVSSSLMLKRRSSSRWGVSHRPQSSWHQLHSPGRLSSSEYDISYVHNSKIKLVQLNICTKKPKLDHYFSKKIQATRYFPHILAQLMPEFTEKSGMTFAKKDISSAWNFPKRKLINTPAKHRPLGGVTKTWNNCLN